MKRFLLTLAATMAVGGSSLFGGTISFSHTTSTGAVPFTDNFTLQEFDTTLGTLTGITITLSDTATAEVDVFNSTSTAQGFTNATASIPLNLTGPASVSVNTTAVAGPIAGTANPGVNAFPGIPGTGSGSTNVASANFGSYEGVGTTFASFSVASSTGNFSGTSVPGVFFGGSATVGAVTTITYTYTPSTGTPEPSTMALLGSSLLGVGFIARKRVKKA